jgi:hypothetical protein
VAGLPRSCASAALLSLSFLAAGCAHQGVAASGPQCPVGHEKTRTAQLFFGREVKGGAPVSDVDFARFVDEELTPRFPGGLTVVDSGGQWREPSGLLVREASKMVLVVLPETPDVQVRLDAVRAAYKSRFRQDSVMLLTQPACVSF